MAFLPVVYFRGSLVPFCTAVDNKTGSSHMCVKFHIGFETFFFTFEKCSILTSPPSYPSKWKKTASFAWSQLPSTKAVCKCFFFFFFGREWGVICYIAVQHFRVFNSYISFITTSWANVFKQSSALGVLTWSIEIPTSFTLTGLALFFSSDFSFFFLSLPLCDVVLWE